MDDENILEHFPKAVTFIREALESEDGTDGVLVHCAMGKSRSATLILAYLLYATRDFPSPPSMPSPTPSTPPPLPKTCLTPSSALSLLRQNHPLAEPNAGFQHQLQLYADMGCPGTSETLDAHPIYQRWLYQRHVETWLAADQAPPVETVRFEDEDGKARRGEAMVERGSGDQVQEEKRDGERKDGDDTQIRCRKCRATLATGRFVVEHKPPISRKKPAKKGGRDERSQGASSEAPCAHVFLTPLSWMRPFLSAPSESSTPAPNIVFSSSKSPSSSSAEPEEEPEQDQGQEQPGPLSGRLLCPSPRCHGDTHVGKFAWQGMSCSCGEWVTPAFALARRCVDILPSTSSILAGKGGEVGGAGGAAIGGAGIRLPPGSGYGDGLGPGRGRI